MTLLNKIKQWRANHKVASTIIDGATAYASMNTAALALEELAKVETPIIQEANADYFDGCRNPKDFRLQLDQRVSLSEGTPRYTLLQKAFIDNNKDGDGLFAMFRFMYAAGETPSTGLAGGGFFDLGSVKLLGAVPIFYYDETKTTEINPVLQATIQVGDFVFDPRIAYSASISGNGTEHKLGFGSTFGYMIDNVILGFDVSTGFDPESPKPEQLGQRFDYQGIIRVDLDQEHKHWIQAYLGKDAVGIGFRTNFDWRK